MRIRVVVLAPDMLSAQGMRALLEKSASIEADACASVGALERRLASEKTDVVLWFVPGAEAEAIAEVHELRMRFSVALCVVAESVDAGALRRAYTDKPAGIAVIRRAAETDVQRVFRTLVQLLAGSVAMSSEVLDELLATSADREEDPIGTLTAAELAVLELVSLGLRNGAIADRLSRSRKLVEKQVGRVFAKLGLRHDEVPDVDRRVMAARAYLLGHPEVATERVAAQSGVGIPDSDPLSLQEEPEVSSSESGLPRLMTREVVSVS